MQTRRTNETWLRDLGSVGGEQTHALEELRGYLLRALPGALKSHGAVPDDLLEDLVQDALLKALDQLHRFQGRSRFTTWATAIAVRTALTELRRRRWKDVSLDDLASGRVLPPPADSEGVANPESEAAQRGIVRTLEAVLDNDLSERQRTAILGEIQGMPQEEIGRRLGIKRNAVYKLTHDARKKLKRGLEVSGLDASEIRAAFL